MMSLGLVIDEIDGQLDSEQTLVNPKEVIARDLLKLSSIQQKEYRKYL